MLVLTRKVGERIRVGDDVVITVVRINGTAVRLGVEAPAGVAVVRQELADRVAGQAAAAAEPAMKEPAAAAS
jgi:carbon storage regulator